MQTFSLREQKIMCCLFPDAIKLTLSILPLYKHRVIEISDDKRPVMVLFFSMMSSANIRTCSFGLLSAGLTLCH